MPPFVPHQEINASADEPLECVVVRSDNEAVVVNLDIEPAEKPEHVPWVDPIHKPPERPEPFRSHRSVERGCCREIRPCRRADRRCHRFVAPPMAHPCDERRGGPCGAAAPVPLRGRPARTSAIDPTVKQLPRLKALKGSGKFDVLEVWGHIYKADYRMRFIYAQIPGSCLLMGQEIIEASDPY